MHTSKQTFCDLLLQTSCILWLKLHNADFVDIPSRRLGDAQIFVELINVCDERRLDAQLPLQHRLAAVVEDNRLAKRAVNLALKLNLQQHNNHPCACVSVTQLLLLPDCCCCQLHSTVTKHRQYDKRNKANSHGQLVHLDSVDVVTAQFDIEV